MGRSPRSNPTARGVILARHIGVDGSRFLTENDPKAGTIGRSRGVHPKGWISGNCARSSHSNCYQLACFCECHKAVQRENAPKSEAK